MGPQVGLVKPWPSASSSLPLSPFTSQIPNPLLSLVATRQVDAAASARIHFMLVCFRRGLSLVQQHTPRFLPSPSLHPAGLFLRHFYAADGMSEGSAARKEAKGKAKAKAPAAASALVVARDDSYLEAVTQKRIRMFEEIQTRQALERLNIGGEVIK